MRRLIAIGVVALLSIQVEFAAAQTTVIDIDLQLSDVVNGARVGFPFSSLPEGWQQGGLLGVSGLPNNGIGIDNGSVIIPPEPFLLSNPATISWGWFGQGRWLLLVTYYICNTANCKRPTAKFTIKTKSDAIGVRG